jgi:hypothetical protein
MRARFPPVLCFLALSGVACERQPSSPVAEDLTPDFQPVRFNRENHFRCYIVSEQTPQPATTVTLTDQFLEDVTLTVDEPLQFCAPTAKTVGEETFEIQEEEEHLTMYVAPQELTPHLTVSTEDQFGEHTLEVVSARVLLVPTEKIVNEVSLGVPDELNHYWCYEVSRGPRVGLRATLEDQFSGPDLVRVTTPRLFCNPVEKTVAGVTTPIEEEEVHLICYEIKGPQKTEATEFGAKNQFEEDEFTVTAWELLCVPAEKSGFVPVE